METATELPPLALAPDRLVVMPVSPTVASAPGTLLSYDAGAAGLAVHLMAEVSARAAEQLDGQRSWVTANVAGRLVAFQAVTRRADRTSLEASGISVPLEEHRRRHVRAADRLRARLHSLDGERQPLAAHTIDLSRGGCRLELTDELSAVPAAGARTQVTLELPDGAVTAAGEVLRVRGAGEIVVRFTGIAPEAGDRIERHVLSLLW